MFYNHLYKKVIFVKSKKALIPIGIEGIEFHVYKALQHTKIFYSLKNAIRYSLNLKVKS
jgi:hypothetical protein